MKPIFFIFFSLSTLLVSCVEKIDSEHSPSTIIVHTHLDIPERIVPISTLNYNNKTSTWTRNAELYSGYAVHFYQDGLLKEKIGFLDGRKQNQTTSWYPDGQLKQVVNYHRGKLHGEKKVWSSKKDHVLVAQLNYHLGKAHGKQKLWYATGELYKVLNLNKGKEDGIQRAFRKNGDLYANYEARAGRIFGLKKSALCFGLKDENIQYEN